MYAVETSCMSYAPVLVACCISPSALQSLCVCCAFRMASSMLPSGLNWVCNTEGCTYSFHLPSVLLPSTTIHWYYTEASLTIQHWMILNVATRCHFNACSAPETVSNDIEPVSSCLWRTSTTPYSVCGRMLHKPGDPLSTEGRYVKV